jgi:hypothetical protein
MKTSFMLAALIAAAALTGCNRQDDTAAGNMPPTSAGPQDSASAPMGGASR